MQKTSDVVALKLEGAVKGPWVEELRKAGLHRRRWRPGGSTY